MHADDVLAVLALLAAADLESWVDGGWGVDALLCEQTRPHEDLDLVVRLDQLDAVRAALREAGFDVVLRDWLPTTLAVSDAAGRSVDLHPVTRTADGGGDQQLQDGGAFHYPPPVAGSIAGQAVNCVDVATQVLCHTGYELQQKDRDDIRRLQERFDL